MNGPPRRLTGEEETNRASPLGRGVFLPNTNPRDNYMGGLATTDLITGGVLLLTSDAQKMCSAKNRAGYTSFVQDTKHNSRDYALSVVTNTTVTANYANSEYSASGALSADTNRSIANTSDVMSSTVSLNNLEASHVLNVNCLNRNNLIPSVRDAFLNLPADISGPFVVSAGTSMSDWNLYRLFLEAFGSHVVVGADNGSEYSNKLSTVSTSSKDALALSFKACVSGGQTGGDSTEPCNETKKCAEPDHVCRGTKGIDDMTKLPKTTYACFEPTKVPCAYPNRYDPGNKYEAPKADESDHCEFNVNNMFGGPPGIPYCDGFKAAVKGVDCLGAGECVKPGEVCLGYGPSESACNVPDNAECKIVDANDPNKTVNGVCIGYKPAEAGKLEVFGKCVVKGKCTVPAKDGLCYKSVAKEGLWNLGVCAGYSKETRDESSSLNYNEKTAILGGSTQARDRLNGWTNITAPPFFDQRKAARTFNNVPNEDFDANCVPPRCAQDGAGPTPCSDACYVPCDVDDQCPPSYKCGVLPAHNGVSYPYGLKKKCFPLSTKITPDTSPSAMQEFLRSSDDKSYIRFYFVPIWDLMSILFPDDVNSQKRALNLSKAFSFMSATFMNTYSIDARCAALGPDFIPVENSTGTDFQCWQFSSNCDSCASAASRCYVNYQDPSLKRCMPRSKLAPSGWFEEGKSRYDCLEVPGAQQAPFFKLVPSEFGQFATRGDGEKSLTGCSTVTPEQAELNKSLSVMKYRVERDSTNTPRCRPAAWEKGAPGEWYGSMQECRDATQYGYACDPYGSPCSEEPYGKFPLKDYNNYYCGATATEAAQFKAAGRSDMKCMPGSKSCANMQHKCVHLNFCGKTKDEARVNSHSPKAEKACDPAAPKCGAGEKCFDAFDYDPQGTCDDACINPYASNCTGLNEPTLGCMPSGLDLSEVCNMMQGTLEYKETGVCTDGSCKYARSAPQANWLCKRDFKLAAITASDVTQYCKQKLHTAQATGLRSSAFCPDCFACNDEDGKLVTSNPEFLQSDCAEQGQYFCGKDMDDVITRVKSNQAAACSGTSDTFRCQADESCLAMSFCGTTVENTRSQVRSPTPKYCNPKGGAFSCDEGQKCTNPFLGANVGLTCPKL
jgi:hypothetical protein